MIVHKHTRYGYNHCFELFFTVKDETLRLNGSLKTGDIDNCIYGSADNVELMQLYKFIEKFHPEKTIGYIKTNKRLF